MHLKATLLKWLKLFVDYILQAIVGYIVVGLIVAGGGVYILTKIGLNWVIQVANTPTPLWVTISLILVCGLYTSLKIRQHQKSYKPPAIQEELREEFGVYWNNQNKLRCLKCKWPLKCSSDRKDPSLFYCSNCNCKHSLRDKNGKHLTEAQAIEQLMTERGDR